jgi:ethanolamine utilization protein EutP
MSKEMESKPWRFMVFGGIGVGKTTLIRALEHKDPGSAQKTQMVDYAGWGIDTPGEYSEMGHMRRFLTATALDAQLLIVVQDATQRRPLFPPNYFLMFPQDTIGVVTKMDLPAANKTEAARLLRQAGVLGEIFFVSALTGWGISQLREYLLSQHI